MSRVRLWVAATVLCLPLMMAESTEAQTVLVCQTPAFWCTIAAPIPVANYPCWCNWWTGPVSGYTVIPAPPQVPPLPPTARIPPGTGSGQPPVIDLNDECFDGLGNCQGAYQGQ